MTDTTGETQTDNPAEAFADTWFEQEDFARHVLSAYEDGSADKCLPANLTVALSWVPPGTAIKRDFSNISQDIPWLDAAKCVGCMECVTECPDSAIIAKVVPESRYRKLMEGLGDSERDRFIAAHFAKTTKYYDVPQRKKLEGGMFMLVFDPFRCKGCGECVDACGTHDAIHMTTKDSEGLAHYEASVETLQRLPETPDGYIQEKVLADMMLKTSTHLYVGGAGSCRGCGEAIALRMMLAATSFVHGEHSMGLVTATGCNTVFGSTYPYNPFLVPWTNSLFENAPAVAMGVRARWDALGWQDKRLWVIGGDGAMLDIGFQSLSRMLMSGMDIKVMVLDTQVYANTGGQTSTATFTGQDAKMSVIGKELRGKIEGRKELSQIAIMHPGVYVAQTTPAHINHFYRAIMTANEFPGPALVNVYTPCTSEHGIGDDMAVAQAKLVVESRGFPLLIHDPRAGDTLASRISLQGNPAKNDDWVVNKAGETVDFITFARSEGRFAKHFDKDGNPSKELLRSKDERLANWHLLQELAGQR